MSRVPELLQAAAALPPKTQAIERLVHEVGIAPDAVATCLGMPLLDVRVHLQAAREARHLLARERETNPVVHHTDATWPQVVEARHDRDDTIMEMVGQGLRPHQVAVRLGVTVHVIYHVMTVDRRRRLAEMRVPRASKRAGMDGRVNAGKQNA